MGTMTDFFAADGNDRDEDFAFGTPAEAEPEAKPSKNRSSRRRAPKPTGAIASALEAIRLSRELADAPDDDVAALAEMLSTTPDADHVAAALATGSKADTSPIDSVLRIAGAQGFEAGILAYQITEDRKAFAKVWSLVSRHADLPVDIPRGNADAATKLAAAIGSMSAASLGSIENTLGLLSR